VIISAVPGRTNVKIVVDADHPVPIQPVSSTTVVPLRVGYGNMQGPYATTDSSRMAQYAPGATLIQSMGVDLFVAVELHEERDMHQLFLKSYLQPKSADWSLCEGDGGNQLLYRPSLFTAKAKPMTMPTGRNLTDFTVTHKVTGLVTHVLGTHTRSDDDDGTPRDAEREQQIKFIAQYAVGLENVVLAGDFNFKSDTIAKLRGILAGAGLIGLQTRVPGIANGNKDSSNGNTSTRWIDDIFTRQQQSVTNAAGVLAGSASDHYLWDKATVGFTVGTTAPPIRMSLYRESGEARVPVPGLQDVVAATTVVTDHTAPLNRDLVYTLELNDGTSTQAPPVQILADLPLLGHPVTGATARVIIQDWPDRTRETPTTLVKVPGRRSPVVLSDVESTPTSSPVLLTRTREAERELDDLVSTGDVLLLRTIYPALPDAFLAVTSRQTGRVQQFKGTSPERLNTLTSQEIGAEDIREAGVGDTLGDLAGAMPGATLQQLADLFPGGTLLDIAVNDWRNAGLVPVIPDTPPSTDAVFPSSALFPSSTTYPGA
jgi:endonuclease/exonuclease/phosphatase family metal-dependent hydrolase